MPIDFHAGNPFGVPITGPEKMYSAVMEYGLLPFFSGDIPGYSVEEMTPPSHWFTSESLGPWDWKIDCIRSGDIAYGKFIRGGKYYYAPENGFYTVPEIPGIGQEMSDEYVASAKKVIIK